MKKRISLFLGVLLLLASMITGCMGTVKQSGFVQNDTQVENVIIEDSAVVEEQTELFGEAETSNDSDTENDVQDLEEEPFLDEDGSYTSKEEVAAYLHQYGKLPSNFITKKEAKKLGWVSNEGNLGEVAPGKSIGGDYFGNYEGQLPEKDGRDYYECDINTDGSYRGTERIVFSDDGLIYYTADHYDSFELLYGDE